MFKKLQEQVKRNFANLQTPSPVFIINLDKDQIWQKYLDGFTDADRQSNTCNCCKSFLRQFAGIVGIVAVPSKKNSAPEYQLKTIWDDIDWNFEGAEEYKNSVEIINKWIKSHNISDVFLHNEKHCGNYHSPDPKNNITWYHYHLELPKDFVKPNVDAIKGDKRTNKEVLYGSLEKLTVDSVETVLELIAQNSLYRGNEHRATLEGFLAIQKEYSKIKNTKSKENYCWLKSFNLSPAISRIKNTAIGTLLVNLSEGMELDKAVGAFERVVAPQNYKRTKSIVTPKMIEDAKKRLGELGLTEALNRRVLDTKDLSVNNSLFIFRPVKKSADVFEQLKSEALVNPKSLTKVEEVTIEDFVSKILPTSKIVKILLENRHLSNFVTLVGPQEKSAGQLLKWDNGISWDYVGGVSDSIAERVKAAGGQTNAILRVSLAWSNTDDLDLSVKDPNGDTIWYGNKRRLSPTGGQLDIDANGGDGMVPNPVENIYWANYPSKEGVYEITVNNFRRRESQNDDWELEVAFKNEEIYHFSGKNGPTDRKTRITFHYSRKGGIVFGGKAAESKGYNSQTKWGLKTGVFHRVKSITNSPNFWNDKPTGNKHFFFFLEGCKYDEKPRAFLNEYLNESLSKDRKVFELLGGKVEIEESSDPLCGIGFSETKRDNIYLEIEGKFKRLLKVNF